MEMNVTFINNDPVSVLAVLRSGVPLLRDPFTQCSGTS
jgi:hypothetical protein